MEILSKLGNIWRYLLVRRKRKLYQQWVEQAGLPPEAVPEEEAAGEVLPKRDKEKIDKEKRKLRPNITYIMLGAAIVLLCAVLILLIIQMC